MGNNKLYRLRELFDQLQVDIVGMNEHWINLGHKSNINGLGKMFQGGEMDFRAIAANNSHKNISRIQEGGTVLLSYGSKLDYYRKIRCIRNGHKFYIARNFKELVFFSIMFLCRKN